jgi:AcrR family transcriptional regulator
MSNTIAVANQKGGVGKTATCVNLGIGLAQEGKKMLLVDNDPKGSPTISLGNSQPDQLLVTPAEHGQGAKNLPSPVRGSCITRKNENRQARSELTTDILMFINNDTTIIFHFTFLHIRAIIKNEPYVIYFYRGVVMPKVNQKYLDQKRNSILNAALKVCRRKPLHQVTMKDIIRESGVSQGGIYRYYKSIDEILVEVINRSSSNIDNKKVIDSIVEAGKTPAQTVKNLFAFLANYMNDNAATLGKFQFELTELVAYEPHRLNSISVQNRHADIAQYLINQLFTVIRNGVSSGDFSPVLPLDDIFGFISTSIDGIVLDGVLHKCYGLPEKEWGFDAIRLMNAVAQSVMMLLSSKECLDA